MKRNPRRKCSYLQSGGAERKSPLICLRLQGRRELARDRLPFFPPVESLKLHEKKQQQNLSPYLRRLVKTDKQADNEAEK